MERESTVRFLEYYGKIHRDGAAQLLEWLKGSDFFEAPASTKYHLAVPEGLCIHSMHVYERVRALYQAEKKAELTEAEEEKLAVIGLLHDVCKAEVYRQEIKHRKNANGKWEDYTGYGVDYSDFPVGHGEKSVIRLLQWGVELRDDEILAIRWHMNAWDLADGPDARGNYGAASDKCPLLAILVAADGLAAHIQEAK